VKLSAVAQNHPLRVEIKALKITGLERPIKMAGRVDHRDGFSGIAWLTDLILAWMELPCGRVGSDSRFFAVNHLRNQAGRCQRFFPGSSCHSSLKKPPSTTLAANRAVTGLEMS